MESNSTLNSLKDSFDLEFSSPVVDYSAIKKKSSQIKLSTREGTIIKIKKRKPIKVIYEFLSLEVWNRLLSNYSNISNLKFCSPSPKGYKFLNRESPELYMSFLEGIPLKKLGQLKGNPTVLMPLFNRELDLFDATSFYLGALNEIKEKENLLHSDYDDRHISFNPRNSSIGVVDVENSRLDLLSLVEIESAFAFDGLIKHINTRRSFSDQRINEFYSMGSEVISSLKNTPYIPLIVDKIKEEYNIDFDFRERIISGEKV